MLLRTTSASVPTKHTFIVKYVLQTTATTVEIVTKNEQSDSKHMVSSSCDEHPGQQCKRCHYVLVECFPDRVCPECGFPFDLNPVQTMQSWKMRGANHVFLPALIAAYVVVFVLFADSPANRYYRGLGPIALCSVLKTHTFFGLIAFGWLLTIVCVVMILSSLVKPNRRGVLATLLGVGLWYLLGELAHRIAAYFSI